MTTPMGDTILSSYYVAPTAPVFEFIDNTYAAAAIDANAIGYAFYETTEIAPPPPYDPYSTFKNNPTVSSLQLTPSYIAPVPTETGLVFNFIKEGYAPPTDPSFVFNLTKKAWGPVVRIFFL